MDQATGTVWGIVLGAGAGSRFGAPKQFLHLGGERLVDRVCRLVADVAHDLVVVVPEGVGWDGDASAVVVGAATRAASVRAGLAAVPAEADTILVHDAAHPLASRALLRRVAAAVVDGAAGAAPFLPATEAMVQFRDGEPSHPLPKADVGLVQTPQAFRADVLRAAHEQAPNAVEEISLLLSLGYPVTAVAGDPLNLHVTSPRDLELAERLLGLAEGEDPTD